MKKLFLLVAMCCIASVATFAQDNKWGIGLNIGYGSDIAKPFMGVRGQYDVTDAFTVAASFNHYFKDTTSEMGVDVDLKCWDINADVHWNVIRKETFKFYPLVGLTYLRAKASAEESGITVSASDGRFGVNLGLGVQFDLGTSWAIGVEAKYQIIDGSQIVPLATIMYRF